MKIIRQLIILIIFVGILLAFLEIIPVAPKYKYENPWLGSDGEPLVIVKMGEHSPYPKNTQFAFEQLIEQAPKAIYVKLALTADEHLVASDAINIQDQTGEDRLIRDLTYASLKQFNFGYYFQQTVNNEIVYPYRELELDDPIRTKLVPMELEQLFNLYNGKFILEVLKQPNSEDDGHAVKKLLELIDKHRLANRVIIHTTEPSVAEALAKQAPKNIMTTFTFNEVVTFATLNYLRLDFFYSPTKGVMVLPAAHDLSKAESKEMMPLLQKPLKKYFKNLVNKNLISEAQRHQIAVIYADVDANTIEKIKALGGDGYIVEYQ